MHITQPRAQDVVIVGGGPAGLLAAHSVAAAGFTATVLERDPEIACDVRTTGGMGISAMAEFEIPPGLYHPISRVRVCSPTEQATFDFAAPIGCVIDVRGTYRHLAARALNRGAVIRTATHVSAPVFCGDRVTGCTAIHSESDIPVQYASRVLIDASGYRAMISKDAKLHSAYRAFGVGAEYDMTAPSCRQDEVLIVVGARYAPAGYAWVFPWGRNRVRVGVGILHPERRANMRRYLDGFVQDIKQFGVNLDHSEVNEYHYGMVPADGVSTRLVGNGVMVAGDAAGQSNLVTGAGVRIAMSAGRLAGQVAAKAIAQGRVDRAALKPYEDIFKARYGRHLAIGRRVTRQMVDYDDARWDRGVRLLQTVPADLFVELCRSQFSISHLAMWTSWLMRRPRLWATAASFAGKVLSGRD